jgi:hypothetical protein
MNPRITRTRNAALAVAVGAGVYALGVLLACLAAGPRPHPPSRNTVQTAAPSRTAVPVQPQAATSNSVLPAITSNAPPPLDALLSTLHKADSNFGVSFFDLHDNLRGLLDKLAAGDFPRLWQELKEFKSFQVREFMRCDVIGVWAKLDPRGALAAAQTLSNETDRESTVTSVLVQWSARDLDSALKLARQIEGEDASKWAQAMIIRRLAEADPGKAARLLEDIPAGPARDRAASAVAGALAGHDPAAATAIADQIRASTDREIAFADIADALIAADPGKALEWAQSLPKATDQTTTMYKLLAEITRSDPHRAIEVLMSQPAQTRDEVVTEVAYTWAGQDAPAAVNWACKLPAGEMQQNALRAIARSCPVEDLKSAGELVLSLPEGPVRSGTLKELGERWQQSSLLGAEGALDLAAQFTSGADRDTFLTGVCRRLNPDHAEEAAKLVETMTTAAPRGKAAEIAASNWSEGDPAAAAAWAGSLPAGDLSHRALAAVSKQWASMDPEAASQWLQTLPADAQRTPAVDAFLGSTLTTRPDLAALWVPAIEDEASRARWLQKVASQWLQKDPEAARSWLDLYHSNGIQKP